MAPSDRPPGIPDDVLFFYRGTITPEVISALSESMDADSAGRTAGRTARYYYLLVECLQNVIHHADQAGGAPEAFLEIRRTADGLAITTGNAFASVGEKRLREAIDMINDMDPAALKKHYLHTLGDQGFSEKGGAGLGLISLARKTGRPLQYHIDALPEGRSYLTLTVII